MSPLTALVYSLHDSLMVLAPRGWRLVELTLVEREGSLRLDEVKARGDGATQPRPPAQLGIDPRHEAQRLSDGLTELRRALEGKWTFGAVEVERTTAGFCDWRLKDAAGKVAWFTRLDAAVLDTLLVTDALLDAVSGTAKAFEALQAQLVAHLGEVHDFKFDTGRGVLTVQRPEGEVELPAQVVGAYLSSDWAWMWSWADPDANPSTIERVRRICAPEAQPPGFSALWRPHFHCDEGFAWTLAGYVAVSIGARGLFRGALKDGSGAALFALLDLPKPA